ncbi:MAG: sulfotransferase [Proteobacteria bacterium TMED72]|nr:MAG: sulfotransferase [Proteobacteria bacterium TMED72]
MEEPTEAPTLNGMPVSIPNGFQEAEEAFHARAVEIAGCDDFGGQDYLGSLRVLLAAYDEEARFNAYGADVARDMVVGALVKRLRSQNQLQGHPDFLNREIKRPLVICGLVRTGSTALHYLMGQDPDLQCLQYWLGAQPQPRPPRADWENHPDFIQADAEIEAMYQTDPSLRAIHFMMPEGPEECRQLMVQEFTDDGFEVNNHVPSYSRWFENVDMKPTYLRHKDLIRLIGSNEPEDKTWLLKYPVHMRFLDTFLEVYPDACVIQTHRDPAAVFSSYVSLISGFRALVEDPIDRTEIARRQLELWVRGADRAIEIRKKHDQAQFYDLHFSDFMQDPVAAVARIKTHFGLSLSGAGEQALHHWQADNPQHKHGKHVYSRASEDVGLSSDEIRDHFSHYMNHYGLRAEKR